MDKLISDLLEDVIRLRESGKTLTDEEILAAHPSLASKLKDPLHALQRVEQAERRASRGIDRSARRLSVSHAWVKDSIPGYEILSEIHRGGQGVVFRARQRKTRREVAIKVIRAGPFQTSDDRHRFEREVRILGQLSHPNIVTIHGSGVVAGSQFLVMDFVPGSPLDSYVGRNALPIDTIVKLLAKICLAVHAAHLRGIVHRDLKPSNIRIDDSGEPHLLDFGLAKTTSEWSEDVPLDSYHTMTGQFMGSMPWASPEQVQSRTEDVDLRTDIYSLGVNFYYLFTKNFPYEVTGTMPSVLKNITDVEPPRPSQLAAGLDDDLDAIILTCLAKDPSRRYQSAIAIAEDFNRYLVHEPLAARVPSTVYQLKKLVKRHKLPFALVLAIFVLTVAFAVSAGLLSRRALREARTSSAVKDFLVRDLLAAADPELRVNRDVSVADVLDNASAKVGGALADQPLVEASVRAVIGESYASLGRYASAEEQLRKAEAIRNRLLNDQDPQTLAVSAKLIEVLRNLEKLDEAKRRCADLLDLCTRALGSDHETTLAVAGQRAWFFWYDGEDAVAQALYDRTIEAANQALGHEHPLTVRLLNERSSWTPYFDVAVRTETELREALAISTKTLGAEHPQSLEAMTNLGLALTSRRRFDEAEPMLRTALETRRRVLGVHPATADSMIKLSSLLREESQLDEAEEVLREAVAMASKTVGPAHPLTRDALSSLANTLLRQPRYAEALAILEPQYERLRSRYGERTLITVNARDQIGLCLNRLGRYKEAEQHYRKVLAIYRDFLPPNAHPMAGCLRRLVRSLVGQGKLEEARPLAVELLEYRKELANLPDASAYQLNCHAWELLTIEPVDLRDPELALETAWKALDRSPDNYHYNRYTLALALHANGQLEPAISYLKLALDYCPLEVSEDRIRYEALLSEYYDEAGEHDAAEQVYRDTLAGRRAQFPSDHPDVLRSLDDLATILIRHQKTDEAIGLLREGLELRQLEQPAPALPFVHTATLLGEALIQAGSLSEAETILLEAYDTPVDEALILAERRGELRTQLVTLYEQIGDDLRRDFFADQRSFKAND